MIDPAKACLYIPPGLSETKNQLFERIGKRLGRVVRHNLDELRAIPADIIPVVGCTPALRPLVDEWIAAKRTWVYWDRGYARRVYATHLLKGRDGGYYRWHIGSFQMKTIRAVPDDRWKALDQPVSPWKKGGRHIVIAAPTRTYGNFHRTHSWIADTIDALARVTDRQLVIRDKESKRRLQDDLRDAHCLVTHASVAAVESVILGCPVFVHSDSAAALVGQTNLKLIEKPVYPERQPWLNSLAYCQWNERELCDGTLWRMIT